MINGYNEDNLLTKIDELDARGENKAEYVGYVGDEDYSEYNAYYIVKANK